MNSNMHNKKRELDCSDESISRFLPLVFSTIFFLNKMTNGIVQLIAILVEIEEIATMFHEMVIMVHRMMVIPDRIAIAAENGNVWR